MGHHFAAAAQLRRVDAAGVRRIAAAVVAPGLNEATILAALREVVDPVFLPRPLRRVDALPRSTTGKLPHGAAGAAGVLSDPADPARATSESAL